MPSTPPLPHLLAPYLFPRPADKLNLVTSVLDATGNWLLLRLLYAALYGDERSDDSEYSVVFVDFLHGKEFWRGEGKRSLGLDLLSSTYRNRFRYVDGLSRLFLSPQQEAAPEDSRSQPEPTNAVPELEDRHPASFSARPDLQTGSTFDRKLAGGAAANVVGRNPPATTTAPTRAAGVSTPRKKPQQPTGSVPSSPSPSPSPHGATQALNFTTLSSLRAAIEQTITSSTSASASTLPHPPPSPPPTILFLANPDLLLSTTPTTTPTQLTSELILPLRSLPHVHSTIVSLQADAPLLSFPFPFPPASGPGGVPAPPDPLASAHATLVSSLAHQAGWVFQVRGLESGRARDVGGVLRISRGGSYESGDWEGDGEEEGEKEGGKEEEERGGEWLWSVGGDGGARVWTRGQ